MVKNPYAVALGKSGGSKKSEAKSKAARENGKLGGRPAKKQVVCLKVCLCYYESFNNACPVHANASALMADLEANPKLRSNHYEPKKNSIDVQQ